MTGRIYQRTPATEAQKQALREQLKTAGIDFSMRTHSEKYCFGAIDVRPTKKVNRRWTVEQAAKAISIAQSLGFPVRYSENPSVYLVGLDYLMNEKTLANLA